MSSRKKNFGNLPSACTAKETSAIAVIPVPYDRTCFWLRGAAKGPDAIIDASAYMERYDIETDSEVYRAGIYTDKPVRCPALPELTVRAVHRTVARHLAAGKFAVVLGGEHSISTGAVAAHAERFKNLSVLHLDAHLDSRDSFGGSKHSHACVSARIREICPMVHVGIRSMDISETADMDRDPIFFAHKLHGSKAWMTRVASLLSINVYVTIDLDVFDPSCMSSVGTPEPGGMDWYDVLALLKMVFKKRNVVGFDVVELCPEAGNKASDFTAALLVYKLLGYKFGNRHTRSKRKSRA